MRFEADLFNGISQIGRTVKLLIKYVRKSRLQNNAASQYKRAELNCAMFAMAILSNCGKLLTVFTSNLNHQTFEGYVNSVRNGKIVKNWTIRMQTLIDFKVASTTKR